MAARHAEPERVFLNIPYDAKFERLYLAYIVGLVELGLKPRATLAIPGGKARLDRIIDLIQSCSYSVHDLSRVEMDRNPPATPRFNMLFELGLAVSWAKRKPREHTWFVFESQRPWTHVGHNHSRQLCHCVEFAREQIPHSLLAIAGPPACKNNFQFCLPLFPRQSAFSSEGG